MNTHKNRVFITAAEVLVPPAQGLSEFLQKNLQSENNSSRETNLNYKVKISKQKVIESLDFSLDPSDPHHPSIKDVKSMRVDVIAMCICLAKMLKSYGESNWSEVPLFVSTGASASGLTEEIQSIYELINDHLSSSDLKRNEQVSRDIHPLFALKALTNSAQAYAAQLFGFRGQNTSFGSTSHASYYAFSEAIDAIQFGESDRVVIGASSGGGFYSQLMNLGLCPEGQSFCESPAAVALILESEKSLRTKKLKALCEVFGVKTKEALPDFKRDESQKYYYDFHSNAQEFAIYSGGASQESFLEEQKAVCNHWTSSLSPYKNLGDTGCASVLLNIALGFQLIKENRQTEVDCLNTDTFFRESCIQLGAPLIEVGQ